MNWNSSTFWVFCRYFNVTVLFIFIKIPYFICVQHIYISHSPFLPSTLLLIFHIFSLKFVTSFLSLSLLYTLNHTVVHTAESIYCCSYEFGLGLALGIGQPFRGLTPKEDQFFLSYQSLIAYNSLFLWGKTLVVVHSPLRSMASLARGS